MSVFSATVINSYVQTLVEAARARGADPEEMLAPLRAEHAVLDQPGQRLPINLMTRLWQQTAEMTGDLDLGLHVGEAMRPGSFHILAPVLMNCATLGDTVEAMLAYQGLVSEGGLLAGDETAQGVTIRYTPGAHTLPMTRFQVECIFACIVTFGRWLSTRDLTPMAVTFTHTVEHPLDEYRRVFRCPASFAMPENTMVLSGKDLRLRIPHADPELLRCHLEIADRFMVLRSEEHQIILELTDLLRTGQPGNRLTLEGAAKHFRLSPRTLQRRLQEADTSFHAIRTGVLMNRAHDLLLATDLPVSRIAEELGYLNTSSFHRRFRDWFGMTPYLYRRRARLPG